jgi:hypothetical protein
MDNISLPNAILYSTEALDLRNTYYECLIFMLICNLVMQCRYSIFKPLLGFCIASVLAFLLISYPLSTFAQNSTFIKPTTGGSLRVQIEPTPAIIKVNTPTKFKISFFKSPGNIQPHIDYDFTIVKNGKGVFSASASTGQTGLPLHTAEGIITIPYQFHTPGNYMLTVKVYGILFNPIRPESSDFPIVVSQ